MGLSQRNRPAKRAGELGFRRRCADIGAAGFDDVIGRAKLARRIAFHSLDRVRDQGVALFEMDVDIASRGQTARE